MHFRGRSTLAAALVLWSALAPAALAAPEPSGTGAHSVPPPAPKPTDSANSPAAPDPRPQRGGIGPDGHAVGGTRLLHRGLIVPAGAPALPGDLTARAWALVDLDDGNIVAARDPHGRYQPASIQKLMTTVAVLPRLPSDRTVTVSRRSAETEGSHAGLVAGGRYTIDDLFEGLLLVSGNDAAEALAAAAGGRAKTVALINRTALALGCYDTLVQTPSGLDGWQQLTSAYDMAVFLRAALAQPRFVHYDRVLHYRLPKRPVVGRVGLYNQNTQFLTTVKGALVAKTGFTDAAQHTFVGAIKRDGHRYGVVFLRAQRYPDDQWVQAAKLVSWATRLPPGTAPVGRLETPPRSAQPSISGSVPPYTSKLTVTLDKADDGSDTPVLLFVLAALVLVAGGLGWLTGAFRAGWRAISRQSAGNAPVSQAGADGGADADGSPPS